MYSRGSDDPNIKNLKQNFIQLKIRRSSNHKNQIIKTHEAMLTFKKEKNIRSIELRANLWGDP